MTHFHLSSVAWGGNSVTYPPFSFVKGGVILDLTPHCLVFMKERDSQQRDLPSAAETHSRCFGLRRDFVVFGNQIFFHKSNIPYLWFLEENSQGHSASVSDQEKTLGFETYVIELMPCGARAKQIECTIYI